MGYIPSCDKAGIAYAHSVVSKTGSSETDTKPEHSTVAGVTLNSLMSSPLTCDSSSGSILRVRSRPKRRLSHLDEDQENIDPSASCDAVTAADQLVSSDKPGLPVSKRHCSNEIAFSGKRSNGSAGDLASTEIADKGRAVKYTSLVSRSAASSLGRGNSKALKDVQIKCAVSCSEDRLHELVGDFSRPLCLPLTVHDKHHDLKAISCHTVSTSFVYAL